MKTTNETQTVSPAIRFPLVALPSTSELDVELELPKPEKNLFQRLIRNPHPDSAYSKERECSEMLCVLLQSGEVLQRCLLRWLADVTDFPRQKLEDYEFEFGTEQWMQGKRDDLRITAYARDSDQKLPVMIWNVEIKVGAGFHKSRRLDMGVRAATQTDEIEWVNQLDNYTEYLDRSVDKWHGFVLALADLTEELPERVIEKWRCTTWTALGEQLVTALRDVTMTPEEKLLARHALGYIRDHLWRTSEMSDLQLDFNDLALMRAFGALREDLDSKLQRLMLPLKAVFERSKVGHGEVQASRSFFTGDASFYVGRRLAPKSKAFVYAAAGIDSTYQDYLSVWLDLPTEECRRREAKLRNLVAKLKDSYETWNTWRSREADGLADWVNPEKTVSLTSLLDSSTQKEDVRQFVEKALDELKQAGVTEVFK